MAGVNLDDIAIGGTVIVTTARVVQNVSFTGAITFAGDIVVGTIRRGTSDGSDNSFVSLAGGGAASNARGALVSAFGNEHASAPGALDLYAGNVTGGTIRLWIAGSSKRIEADGTGLGFFGATPVAKPTGVAVSAAGIHAALVSLGLIAA